MLTFIFYDQYPDEREKGTFFMLIQFHLLQGCCKMNKRGTNTALLDCVSIDENAQNELIRFSRRE